jgi:hypothetical protein
LRLPRLEKGLRPTPRRKPITSESMSSTKRIKVSSYSLLLERQAVLKLERY